MLSLRQIAAADVILLNKIDIAGPYAVSQTESLIRHVNPAAPLHRTIKGEIDLRHIIGIAAYRNPPPLINNTQSDEKSKDHVHTAACDDHGEEASSHPTHYELRGISSIQVLFPDTLSQAHFDALDKWIRNALWEDQVRIRSEDGEIACDVQILRCKGVFRDEESKWHVLQGVRSVYEISELKVQHASASWENIGVPDKGKIVLIGKGLNEKVKESLQRIFIT